MRGAVHVNKTGAAGSTRQSAPPRPPPARRLSGERRPALGLVAGRLTLRWIRVKAAAAAAMADQGALRPSTLLLILIPSHLCPACRR